jgi:hypothetical protein
MLMKKTDRLGVKSTSRREFTVQAVLAILSGYVITVSDACSSSTPTTPTTPTTPIVDINGVVSANHGHIAIVTAAQITAGSQVDLDITGQATHKHIVTLTAANMTTLKARPPQALTVNSTTDNGHSHTITFTPV